MRIIAAFITGVVLATATAQEPTTRLVDGRLLPVPATEQAVIKAARLKNVADTSTREAKAASDLSRAKALAAKLKSKSITADEQTELLGLVVQRLGWTD